MREKQAVERFELVRRLLGTSTQLFLDDADPVSVHCLAASAAEHGEHLTIEMGGEPFKSHVFTTFPDLNEKGLKRLRNRYWTVIEHSHDLKNKPFDVKTELAEFNDSSNDAVLFCGWYDFMMCGYPIPAEVQVFQLWFFRIYPNSLNPEKEFEFEAFSDLKSLDRSAQKQRLRQEIEKALHRSGIIDNIMTDRRPLILG